MEALSSKDDVRDIEAKSLNELLDSQKELFHSQINELQKIVVAQCRLTGVNPLAQEMAAGALSIKIGKRPRDLLNPKAIKYMELIFSIKDTISKKECREIGALFGVTVTQVRDFFASQRSRLRKLARLSKEKVSRSNGTNDHGNGVHKITGLNLVPLNSVPAAVEETPGCSTQDETLKDLNDSDKKFVDNIFDLMRKEETFTGQVKLMEWILQIENSSVLHWFSTKGGLVILATWLTEAAAEEQTSVLYVIIKVLNHLPLHNSLPVHSSAVLLGVNRLRFYRSSDVSNKAKALIARWSKMLARSQALKKPNGLRSSGSGLNSSRVDDIMVGESWKSNIQEELLAPSFQNVENARKLEPPPALKLLPAATDDTSRRNSLVSSQTRERRKVQLMEQPGQRAAGRNSQTAKAAPVKQSRPMSADDIQKAKMRALFMQSKYGKNGTVSSENKEPRSQGLNKPSASQVESHGLNKPSATQAESHGLNKPSATQAESHGLNKPSTTQAEKLSVVSKVTIRQNVDEHKKPVIVTPETVNKPRNIDASKPRTDSKEIFLQMCKRVPWRTPPEMRMDASWMVGVGENSKEVEVQKNRNRREKETIYLKPEDIPPNPKDPWDLEMDFDDSLTPEIPSEQAPDADAAETTNLAPNLNENNNKVPSVATSSQVTSGGSSAEPDLELLAVLLRNPELVFALTGQAGNLSGEQTTKLLDMIKSGGGSLVNNLNEMSRKVEEKVEVSLPSPTPSNDPGTSGWGPEVAKNPFSQQNSMANAVAYSPPVATTNATEKHTVPSSLHSQTPVSNFTLTQQLRNVSALPQQPQGSVASYALPQMSSMAPSLSWTLPTHSLVPQAQASVALPPNNLPASNVLPPSLQNTSLLSMRGEGISSAQTTVAREKQSIAFQNSPMFSTPAEPQAHANLQSSSYPRLSEHRQFTNVQRPTVGPNPDSWRGRPGLDSDPYYQANKYNGPYEGPTMTQSLSGPPRRDEIMGDDEYEDWSPENSPLRPHGYRAGANPMEPRMNYGRNYMPDRSRPNNFSGSHDHNRHGNRRWRDRRH